MSAVPALLVVGAGATAVVTTRVQLLPDVIDYTVILTGAGLGGLACMSAGAALRFDPERLGRLTVLASWWAARSGFCSS
jgi:hypothetical protein